jgi:hypothetical protein
LPAKKLLSKPVGWLKAMLLMCEKEAVSKLKETCRVSAKPRS